MKKTKEQRIAEMIDEIKKIKEEMRVKTVNGSITPNKYRMLCDEIRSLVGQIERLKRS